MKRSMQNKAAANDATLRRRDVLLALGAGASVAAGTLAAAAPPLVGEVAANGIRKDDRRKALYQANSPEVQTYYRVNRYPK